MTFSADIFDSFLFCFFFLFGKSRLSSFGVPQNLRALAFFLLENDCIVKVKTVISWNVCRPTAWY